MSGKFRSHRRLKRIPLDSVRRRIAESWESFAKSFRRSRPKTKKVSLSRLDPRPDRRPIQPRSTNRIPSQPSKEEPGMVGADSMLGERTKYGDWMDIPTGRRCCCTWFEAVSDALRVDVGSTPPVSAVCVAARRVARRRGAIMVWRSFPFDGEGGSSNDNREIHPSSHRQISSFVLPREKANHGFSLSSPPDSIASWACRINGA